MRDEARVLVLCKPRPLAGAGVTEYRSTNAVTRDGVPGAKCKLNARDERNQKKEAWMNKADGRKRKRGRGHAAKRAMEWRRKRAVQVVQSSGDTAAAVCDSAVQCDGSEGDARMGGDEATVESGDTADKADDRRSAEWHLRLVLKMAERLEEVQVQVEVAQAQLKENEEMRDMRRQKVQAERLEYQRQLAAKESELKAVKIELNDVKEARFDLCGLGRNFDREDVSNILKKQVQELQQQVGEKNREIKTLKKQARQPGGAMSSRQGREDAQVAKYKDEATQYKMKMERLREEGDDMAIKNAAIIEKLEKELKQLKEQDKEWDDERVSRAKQDEFMDKVEAKAKIITESLRSDCNRQLRTLRDSLSRESMKWYDERQRLQSEIGQLQQSAGEVARLQDQEKKQEATIQKLSSVLNGVQDESVRAARVCEKSTVGVQVTAGEDDGVYRAVCAGLTRAWADVAKNQVGAQREAAPNGKTAQQVPQSASSGYVAKTTNAIGATWAGVARDQVGEQQMAAMKRMVFEGRFPVMEGGDVWLAMQNAAAGQQDFTMKEVCTGVYRFDYTDPRVGNFVAGRGDRDAWKRAWMRREMRGLVVRNTGEVIVRGLHKFFNLGQLKETKVRALKDFDIEEVTEKLDGQMVVGVVVDDEVVYWSRKGLTPVGVTASRVANEDNGDLESLVRAVHSRGATATFEFVGYQSRIKSDEGKEPKLILTAVREHVSGRYWRHEALVELGEHHQVQVVRRFRELESLPLGELQFRVSGWKKEGVIVRMCDGTMVKVKSEWWFRAGYCERYRSDMAAWKAAELVRANKMEKAMRTRGQRLAIIRMTGVQKPVDLFKILPNSEKIEVVYNCEGKVTVVIVSFATEVDMKAAVHVAVGRRWRAQQAYSVRTRGKHGRRIELFYRHGR